MDAELAVNLFSDQLYGRLLAELQHSDGLPNIPIADLGDLDINIPQPQNGGFHWATNNNNNNEVLPVAVDNSWGDPRQQCHSGMKRQFQDISGDQHDRHHGGERGSKLMRVAGDVAPYTSNTDASLITVNRDTNQGLINSLDGRNVGEIRHSSRNYPASVASIEDTPTTNLLGCNIQEGFSRARRVRNSVDSFDGSTYTESPEGDGKIQDFHSTSIDSSPAAGIGATDSCYQQVLISPASATAADYAACDSKLDLQSAGPESKISSQQQQQQHPRQLPSAVSETELRQKWISNSAEEKTFIQKGLQHGKSDDSGQSFLDWAMANGLLESESDTNGNVSCKESVTTGASTATLDHTGSTQKVHSSSEKDNQIAVSSIQSDTSFKTCALCHLKFRKSEHLLGHLKQVHPKENFYQCPDCAAKLEDLQLLEDHMKVHSLISNITADDAELPDTSDDCHIGCEVCQAVFPSEDALSQHHSTYHSPKQCSESTEWRSPTAHNRNKRFEVDSAITTEYSNPSSPKQAAEDINSSSSNKDLNNQAAQMTRLSTKADITINNTHFNSTNSHLYSEQDFMHLNFKREYSEEQPDKEAPSFQIPSEPAEEENCTGGSRSLDQECNNVFSLQTETNDHKNRFSVNLPQDSGNDKILDISTCSTPETDIDQTQTGSELCVENILENTQQPPESGQTVKLDYAAITGKETTPEKHQSNDICSEQNGVSSLSGKQNSSEHDDDNGLVLLCNIDTAVSKVKFSSFVKDTSTDVVEDKTTSVGVIDKVAAVGCSLEQIVDSNIHVHDVTYNDTDSKFESTTLNFEGSADIPGSQLISDVVTPKDNAPDFQQADFARYVNEEVCQPTKTATQQEQKADSVQGEIKGDTTEGKTAFVKNWVQLTESNTVIPPHMPNYTTYKCLTCAISFMSEKVLKRHCEAHLKPKKRLKKKRSKSKKTKKRKSSDPDETVKNSGEAVDVLKPRNDAKNDCPEGKQIRPVIVSYDESDNEDNEEAVEKKNIDNPQVMDGSLLSRHVKLFQEYL